MVKISIDATSIFGTKVINTAVFNQVNTCNIQHLYTKHKITAVVLYIPLQCKPASALCFMKQNKGGKPSGMYLVKKKHYTIPSCLVLPLEHHIKAKFADSNSLADNIF